MSSHIPSLDCAVDRAISEPLVQQLYRQLRDLVLAGRVPAGSRLPSTRDLAHHLRRFRGIECSPAQIFITGGKADALQMIGKAVARQARSPSAWVEDPTYISACTTLAREGLEIHPIPVDDEGLCVDVGLQV